MGREMETAFMWSVGRSGCHSEPDTASIVARGRDAQGTSTGQRRVLVEHQVIEYEAAGREHHAALCADGLLFAEGFHGRPEYLAVPGLVERDAAMIGGESGGAAVHRFAEFAHEQGAALVFDLGHMASGRGASQLAEGVGPARRPTRPGRRRWAALRSFRGSRCS